MKAVPRRDGGRSRRCRCHPATSRRSSTSGSLGVRTAWRVPPSARPSRTIDASLPWRADRSRRREMALRVANDRACEHSPHIGRRRAGAWHRVLGTLARLTNLVLAPRTFLVLFTLAWLAYACGALVTAQLRGRVTVVVILTVGVLSRVLLLPAVPSLSTDAYRYVWDARVSSAGIDPYAYPPVASEVAGLRDTNIYPRLNHS